MSVSLVFMEGSLSGMRFSIPEAGAVVGRSHVCGIRVTESDVSGQHVRIVPGGDGAEMTVLSLHRTFLNGRRLRSGAKTQLGSGDLVRLGESLEFAFMADDSPAGGDSTLLFPEAGVAGGGTRATVGTRATMATRATTAGPPTGVAASGGYAETTAVIPTGASTAATRLPGEDKAEDGETQMLKTQMVSREELEQLGRMYAEKRRRKATVRSILLGLAFCAVLGVYFAIMARKPETELSIPGDERKEVFTENSGDGGIFGLKVPAAPDMGVKKTANAQGGSNIVVRTRLGAKWEAAFLIELSWYRDPACLHETREESFDRWAASNLVPNTPEGDFTDLGLMNDNAFIGAFNGTLQGIRCLSREYSRAKGDTYYGIVSFFRYGDRCYVLRREVRDAEKERANKWLVHPGEFLVFDGKGVFVKRHWEGLGEADPMPADSCSAALLRCEEYLGIDSPADWKLVEQTLYRVLAAADEAGDTETGQRALSLLVELRDRMSAKWKGLWAERTVAANSKDKVQEKDVDRRVRAVFWDKDDARYGLCRREKWWRRR